MNCNEFVFINRNDILHNLGPEITLMIIQRYSIGFDRLWETSLTFWQMLAKSLRLASFRFILKNRLLIDPKPTQKEYYNKFEYSFSVEINDCFQRRIPEILNQRIIFRESYCQKITVSEHE